MIKAVIFDYDGTLADRCKATSTAYRKYLIKYIINEKIDKVLLETMVQDLVLWDEFGAGSKRLSFEKFEKRYNYHIDHAHFIDWWIHNAGKYEPLFPNTLAILNYLKEKYKLAIITNGTVVGQNVKIDSTGIRNYFDEVVISHEVGIEKPDPKIFKLTIERLNVKPDEAVYVGDSYHNDIFGAYQAGLKPIWIWANDGRENSDGIIRIYDIAELKDIL